ncbi:MAG: sigma-70 family RNA polymerase sigma factor [Candidatus Aureabacteria bacterium]|nr:sigma-70 family RNA polymerase sigma factor [Candidatus Auribacterota bacterium]
METEKQKDQAVIGRVLSGERDAYEDIIKRYQAKICSVCYSVVHNYADAQDLSQDVFLRAYENLSKFSGKSSFYTWLYRIAKNVSIDFRRKHGKVTKVELIEGLNTGESDKGPSGPREDLNEKELGKVIREAIDELPEEQKEVIILREINGLSYNEITETLGCSEGTVMSRLHYARKKLAQKLKIYRES